MPSYMWTIKDPVGWMKKASGTVCKNHFIYTANGLVYFLSMILIAITLSAGQTLGDKYTIKYIEHVVVAHL